MMENQPLKEKVKRAAWSLIIGGLLIYGVNIAYNVTWNGTPIDIVKAVVKWVLVAVCVTVVYIITIKWLDSPGKKAE